MLGWRGTILRVDLTTGKAVKRPLSNELKYGYIGGRGINSRILYDEVGPDVEPLSPEARLIFGAGPLVGTASPCSGRWTVTAKSPLTGLLGDANAGGFFAPELKYAGYDHVVIQGRAENPVYLYIDDANVEIRDAGKLWGSDVWQTDKMIKEDVGDDVQVAAIGRAGENLVKYACILSNLARAAGRTGMGAVMGFKHLKAIAVRGTNGVKIARPDAFEKAIRKLTDKIISDPLYKTLSVYGTSLLVERAQEQGWLPTLNNQQTDWDEAEKVGSDALVEKYVTNHKGCQACPIHCSHFYRVEENPEAYGEGPEYEGIDNLGPRCGNSNLASILYMNTLCNRLGIDEISVGNAISWAMECYQRNIITEKDTGGIKLEWGDYETMIELIKLIANREGFGDLLAEGAPNASKRIGRGSEKYVMHTKGLTQASADPRGKVTYGLAYAVATRGGDHLRGLPSAEYLLTPEEISEKIGIPKISDRFGTVGKAKLLVWIEHVMTLANALGICVFPITMIIGYEPEEMAEILSAATGWDANKNTLLDVGERIVNLERAYCVRLGISKKYDTLPERQLKEPSPARGSKGHVVPLETMLPEYYEARHWDIETGIPTEEKLNELNLKEIATEMKKLGKYGSKERN